jgi:hypothetical protein
VTGVTAEIGVRRERAQEAKRRITDSVRLGPESFAPVVPDAETAAIAQAAAVLGEERS